MTALDGLDLVIWERESVSLVGPSGCGKSTLLRILVVFQDYSILPWKTVEANAAFGPRMQGTSKAQALAKARTWLGKLGLAGFGRHYPATLSGGMKQRVAIARALALNPEVLLQQGDLKIIDVALQNIAYPDMTGAFANGSIDAAYVTSGASAAIEERDLARLFGDQSVYVVAATARSAFASDLAFTPAVLGGRAAIYIDAGVFDYP